MDPASIDLQPEVAFNFDADNQLITFNEPLQSDVEVCYRVISPLLTTPTINRDINLYGTGRFIPSAQTPPKSEILLDEDALFSTPGLYKSGSITRGITVGNRQSLFVNSNLNLQLDGQLADNLFLSAVITDQNIPYQPEGNTQQLRDFDNVFIKLYNRDFDLILGDVVLTNPIKESYFLKYYKNVQGGRLAYRADLGKWKSETTVGASAAKGRFASIQVDPIEGVQGPYRLRGPEGERFIIVLANSERVFIDGEQLQRGFNNDYVIDYNLGEVIFNNNVVITRFTRIRIDFEFIEQNYARSNLAMSQRMTQKDHDVYVSYYRERDNRNSPLNGPLSQSEIEALRELGDAPGPIFVDGTDSVGYSADRLLYRKKDTVVDATQFEIYELSTDPNEAVYDVRFTEVGFGLGDYLLVNGTSNGRVYEWIAPQGGASQGNFAPVVQLAAPNQRQMVVVGSKSSLGKLRFEQEAAFSHRDDNLFSELDAEDDNGFSWRMKAGYDSLAAIGRYRLSLNGSFEFNEKDFRAIDRFRAIEFDRNWSHQQDTLQVNQYLSGIGLSLYRDTENYLQYQFESRHRTGSFNGTRQLLTDRFRLGPVLMNGRYFWLRNTQLDDESEWLQTDTDVSVPNRWLVPGYRFRSDQSQLRTAATDSVTQSIMYFHSHEAYMQNSDSSFVNYRLSYRKRYDKTPVEGRLVDFTSADNLNLAMSLRGQNHQHQVDFNFRRVDDFINDEQLDQLQGRWIANDQFLNGHIRSNMSLAISSGRELRREFIYVLVNTGEGTHTWRDENGDGLKDLNEFYEAINPDEKEYIKLFTPTDEYITVFRNQYAHTLDIAMPRAWKSHSGLRRELSKISYLINLNLDNKTGNESLAKRVNPFAAFQEDEEIISRNNRTRYTVFYNRVSSGLAGEVAYNELTRRQLLTNGFEARQERSWFFNGRTTLNQIYGVAFTAQVGELSNSSDFLDSRNFDLIVRSYKPSVTWQPSTSFRVIGSYEHRRKNNTLPESAGERSVADDWSLDATFSRPAQGNFNARISLIDIAFEGEENSFLGYTLLDALRPGTNFTANVNWQHQIAKALQLTVQYFGRKSQSADFVHTGTVQLTAFF